MDFYISTIYIKYILQLHIFNLIYINLLKYFYYIYMTNQRNFSCYYFIIKPQSFENIRQYYEKFLFILIFMDTRHQTASRTRLPTFMYKLYKKKYLIIYRERAAQEKFCPTKIFAFFNVALIDVIILVLHDGTVGFFLLSLCACITRGDRS